MSDLVKTKAFETLIYDYILEFGLQIPDNPIAACKIGMQKIKDKKKDQFINDVLGDLKNIDLKDIEAEKSLAKLYKSLQVIAKATTQEKINRFKKLTVNGIIYQDEISENDYELYLRLVEELTDIEFLILSIIYELHSNILVHNKIDQSCKYGEEINWTNLRKTVNKLKTNGNQQIAITEQNFIDIIKNATKITQEEILCYKRIIHSKGLIEFETFSSGEVFFKNISNIGQRFMEFINKEGNNA